MSLATPKELYEPSNPSPMSHSLNLNIKTSIYASLIIAWDMATATTQAIGRVHKPSDPKATELWLKEIEKISKTMG